MSYEPTSERSVAKPSKVSITAGSAIKLGFLGAFGWFLFSLVVSVLGVLIAAAAGVDFGQIATLVNTLTGA